MQWSIGRLLLVVLVVLLGVQLTGLSCLNDWQSITPWGNHPVHDPLSSGLTGTDQPGDDGCPCHLFFKYVDLHPLHVASPLLATLTPLSAGYAPIFVRFLFHPPILG